jgi:hypothetical protein
MLIDPNDVVLLALAQFVEDAMLLDADSVELRDAQTVVARWVLPPNLKPGHRDWRRAINEMTDQETERLEIEGFRLAAEIIQAAAKLGDQAEVRCCGRVPVRPGHDVFRLRDRDRDELVRKMLSDAR